MGTLKEHLFPERNLQRVGVHALSMASMLLSLEKQTEKPIDYICIAILVSHISYQIVHINPQLFCVPQATRIQKTAPVIQAASRSIHAEQCGRFS
jgi:hypothetical protein